LPIVSAPPPLIVPTAPFPSISVDPLFTSPPAWLKLPTSTTMLASTVVVPEPETVPKVAGMLVGGGVAGNTPLIYNVPLLTMAPVAGRGLIKPVVSPPYE